MDPVEPDAIAPSNKALPSVVPRRWSTRRARPRGAVEDDQRHDRSRRDDQDDVIRRKAVKSSIYGSRSARASLILRRGPEQPDRQRDAENDGELKSFSLTRRSISAPAQPPNEPPTAVTAA